MARTVINQANLNRLLMAPGGPVATILLHRGTRVQSRAKQLCPVDQGRLRSTIYSRLSTDGGRLHCRVGTNVSYARFVHDGTGLYGPKHARIYPKNGSVMVFPVRGTTSRRPSRVAGRGVVTTRSLSPTGFVFVRSTRGMKGTPFLRDALRAA